MRLANVLPAFHARGAEVVGLCPDSPGRNLALVRRWHLPFAIESDAGGHRLLRELGLWEGEGMTGDAVPSLTLVLPSGERAYHYRSRDFADRPDDDELLARLEAARVAPLEPPPSPWAPEIQPEEHPDAYRTEAFGPYMRGVRSAAIALSGRAEGPFREELGTTLRMADSFLAAWKQRRAEAAGGS